MHLKTIKLSGFKSFLDMQLLQLPSRVTAIVGPNGCGKSNVIDAVKWVIGESHAKQLRGDHMTDVIFNGSTQRKPVGQAHVELTFDNQSHSLKGPFSHYHEVTVKRTIGRDAHSLYAINQTRCRRKDVVDLFTGTGLGPRSYAIIEQGMINRFIEAKPAELRSYLEEAAGISRYYEKRKETAAHLEETAENLQRIQDLEREIQKRCVILEQQAQEAAQYQSLRSQIVSYRQQYFSVLYHQYHARSIELTEAIQRKKEEATEKEKAYLHYKMQWYALEKEKEDTQKEYQETKDALHHKIQLKQQSQHQVDQVLLKIQWSFNQKQEALKEKEHLNQKILETQQWLQDHTPADDDSVIALLSTKENELAVMIASLDSQEKHIASLEKKAKDYTESLYQKKNAFDKSTLQIQHLQKENDQKSDHLTHLQKEQEKWQQQKEEVDPESLQSSIAMIQTELEDLEKKLKENKTCYEDIQSQVQEVQTHYALLERDVTQLTKRSHDLDKEINAYKKTATTWLNPLQMPQCVTQQTWSAFLPHLSAVATQFFYKGQKSVTALQLKTQADLDLEYVWGDHVPSYWHGMIPTDDVDYALEHCGSLADHQAYVLPNGALLGRNWVRPWRKKQPLLIQIEEEKKSCDLRLETARLQWDECKKKLSFLSQRKNAHSHEITQLTHQITVSKKQEQDILLKRERLAQQYKELSQRLEKSAYNQEQSKQHIMHLQSQIAEQKKQQEHLHQEVQSKEIETRSLSEELHILKQLYKKDLDEKNKIVDSLHKEKRSFDLAHMQYDQYKKQLADFQKRYQAQEDLLQKNELALIELQKQKEYYETEWQAEEPDLDRLHHDMQKCQKRLEDMTSNLQKAQKASKDYQRDYQVSQESLSELQSQQEKNIWNLDHLIEQILDQGWLAEQIAQVVTQAKANDLKASIAQMEEQLKAMGAVNLKALHEYETQKQRYEESVQQRQDLENAVQALQEAIALLDQDMKELFDTTFTELKKHFETLFPILFSGGTGTLSLERDPVTGENGVIIHAQPPGKKNTRLTILSGGEKALTASALIFSFFQLNPAPFCLLDEIDAPLDDANTHRLGAMIHSLKDRIQFIVVTHSKVMMEYAQALYGVTMKEPGVSKFVSVDLREAMALMPVE